jgi:ribosomal-protein-alanine N-acetyltransferase
VSEVRPEALVPAVPAEGLVPAVPAHGAALALIHAACFPPEGRWGLDAMALQLELPGAFGWIAEAGGMVLARTVADEAEILTLAVAPAMRRRGLAGRLLDRAMATARARGAAIMLLEVGVANAAAQALYAGRGFLPVGRRRGYYAGGEDALILRASLPEVPPCG